MGVALGINTKRSRFTSHSCVYRTAISFKWETFCSSSRIPLHLSVRTASRFTMPRRNARLCTAAPPEDGGRPARQPRLEALCDVSIPNRAISKRVTSARRTPSQTLPTSTLRAMNVLVGRLSQERKPRCNVRSLRAGISGLRNQITALRAEVEKIKASVELLCPLLEQAFTAPCFARGNIDGHYFRYR